MTGIDHNSSGNPSNPTFDDRTCNDLREPLLVEQSDSEHHSTNGGSPGRRPPLSPSRAAPLPPPPSSSSCHRHTRRHSNTIISIFVTSPSPHCGVPMEMMERNRTDNAATVNDDEVAALAAAGNNDAEHRHEPTTNNTGCGCGACITNPLQIMAMLSNFSTSYNVVNISLVLPMLRQLYHDEHAANESMVASSLLAGMMLGQLLGGWLGDTRLGRLGALQLVMLTQIGASLGAAWLVHDKSSHLYESLAGWRLLLGVGAGGVYPLAAVLSAEEQHHNNKSLQAVVWTFSMQGWGFLAAPLLATILLYTTHHLELIWRLLLGLGSVPGLLLLVLQWRVYHYHRPGTTSIRRDALPQHESRVQDETAWHRNYDDEEDEDDEDLGTCLDSSPNIVTDDAETLEENDDDGIGGDDANNGYANGAVGNDNGAAIQDAISTGGGGGGWSAMLREPHLGRKLLGTAGTWFLFDVLFYGNTLFEPMVIQAAFNGSNTKNGQSDHAVLQETAVNSLLLATIALPGYLVAAALLGRTTYGIVQSPRYVMLQGFACMSLLYLAIGASWHMLRHFPFLLVLLYGLTFFFANYGPNTTTFVMPSLVFSPSCRSTWNGVAAACGKMGALTGASLFAPAADRFGAAMVMFVCAVIGLVAFCATQAFVQVAHDNVDNAERRNRIDENDVEQSPRQGVLS